MSNLFDTVFIIGIGHIGSSVAIAMRQSGQVGEIIASDTQLEHETIAITLGHVDRILSIEEGAKRADLVIIATPIGAVETICQQIAPYLNPGTVVSDVGSTKLCILKTMERIMPKTVEVVPAHPIAGIEKSGPSNAIQYLFSNRWVVLTPSTNASTQAVAKIDALWSGFGANVTTMNAEQHDQVLAVTSHVPHLIAYCIVGTASDLGKDLRQEVIKYSAGGFRDFTRIAGSDPIMWRDVFLNNKDAVLEILGRFSEDLSELQRAIRRGDGEFLQNKFAETRSIRQTIVDSGQAGQYDPTEKTS